jgi:hypothetical protein
VATELDPSERVLWSGKPVRWPFFDPSDLVVAPLSILAVPVLLWLGWATSDGSAFGTIWRWGVVAIGVYNVIGRPILRWLVLRGTTYTVTDRRVLVETRTFGLTLRSSHEMGKLPPLKIVERRDGTGDLRFSGYRWHRGPLSVEYSTRGSLVLRAIEEPRRVADLIVLKR